MAFDAGSVESSLTIDTSPFDRSLDAAKAKADAFAGSDYKVKISAVFDTSSFGKARQMFAQLDDAISKDAMNRLRSSPQGSVLGALNALFSPHQVTGAPTASQAASQGLLGQMVGGQNGGTGTLPAGNGTDDIRQVLTGQQPGNVSTTDDIRQNLTGNAPGNVTTTDTIDQKLAGNAPGNTTTTNTVREKLDPSAASKTESDAKASGDRAGKNWGGAFSSAISGILSRLLNSEGGEESGHGKEQGALDTGLLGGLGPGILGTSFKASSIAGLAGAALGALPALGGVAAGVTAVGGGAALLFSQDSQLKTQAETMLKGLVSEFTAAAGPMIKPLQQAVSSLGATFKSVGPEVGQIFSAAAPLIAPFTAGLEGLVTGLLPGLLTILKAVAPAMDVFDQFVSNVGKDLGEMFTDFAPAISSSSVLLKALLDVVTGLFPVLGQVGSVLASVLGPAFSAFAGAIEALEPFLSGVAKIFGEFAGAVLQDLGGALQLVAGVLKSVSPAFDILATSLGQVFNTLESKGGFAQLGDVLEGLAAPLGGLVTTLVDGLAPAIPPLLTLFSDFVNVASTVAVSVLTALIPPLVQLAETAITPLVALLPVAVPLVTKLLDSFTADAGSAIVTIGTAVLNLAQVALTALLKAAQPLIPVAVDLLTAFTPLLGVFTSAAASAIASVADALAAVISAIPPSVLTGVAVAVGAVVGAFKLWGAATTVVATGIDATLGGAIGGAIGSLKEFALATEGVTLADKGMLAGMLALDAITPFGWVVLAGVAIAGLAIGVNTLASGSKDLEQTLADQDDATGYNISGYQKLASQLTSVAGGYQKLAQAQQNVIHGAGDTGAASLAAQYAAQGQQVTQLAQNMQARLTALSGSFGVSQTQIEQWASAAGISAQKFAGTGENVSLLTTQVAAYVNKNAAAITSTASVATNVALLGDSALSATTQLDAFNAIWTDLVGNLLSKQEALTQSKASFQSLTQTISSSGKDSTAAVQSFQQYVSQVGAAASALQKSGASVSTINGYLQTQISNIKSLGPLNASEKADLQALTTFQTALANSTKGLTANQTAYISQVEAHIIPDLTKLHANTPLVNTDVKNLADSIAQTGTSSASTESDRAQLIKDLEAAGLSAQGATTLVDNLTKALNNIPKTVSSTVTITEALANVTTVANEGSGPVIKKAAGGYVTGPGGPTDDSIPAWLSNGEYVMSAAAVSRYGLGFLGALNAQEFAAGGVVGGDGAYAGRRYALGGPVTGRAAIAAEYARAQDAQAAMTGSLSRIEGKFDKLIRATEQVPAGVGAHVGGAISGAAHDASFRARYPRGS